MGCVDKPNNRPGQGEVDLAKLARDQYAYYKASVVPVENAELAQIARLDTPGSRASMTNRAVGAAREGSPVSFRAPPGLKPGGGRMLTAATRLGANRGTAITKGFAAGTGAAEDLVRGRQLQSLAVGRGLSRGASSGLAQSAGFSAGRLAAESAGRSAINGMLWQAGGELAGTGIGYGLGRGGFGGGGGAPQYNQAARDMGFRPYQPGQINLWAGG